MSAPKHPLEVCVDRARARAIAEEKRAFLAAKTRFGRAKALRKLAALGVTPWTPDKA